MSLLRPLVDDLAERRAQARLGGGDEKIAHQHEQGKLTARERLDAAVRRGRVHRARHPRGHPLLGARASRTSDAPADGVITGYGKVDGRLVAVAAYDFTVMAGSMGMTGETKVARLRELALTKRLPLRVAARLRRRAHPGGRRLALRRHAATSSARRSS